MATSNDNSPAARENQEQFERLGLQIGDVLFLETYEPATRYGVRLLGYLQGKSILVTNPVVSGKLVLLRHGRPVTVRALVRNKVVAFSTQVRVACAQPYAYLHLDWPREVVAVEVRNSERVAVTLPVSVSSEFDVGAGEWPQTALIYDLSRSGAGVRSMNALGDVNHEIQLNFQLNVAGVDQVLHMPVTIRNRQRVSDQPGQHHFIYGVAFSRLTDAQRIVLNGFIYEQAALGQHR